VRPSGGFGMILNAERTRFEVLDALAGVVVEVQVGHAALALE
jgi:hypothetical protein